MTAAKKIQWNRSDEGSVTSKCGLYYIQPLFMGRTTAQAFAVYFKASPDVARVEIKRYADTQRDAKDVAQGHADRMSAPAAAPLTLAMAPTLTKAQIEERINALTDADVVVAKQARGGVSTVTYILAQVGGTRTLAAAKAHLITIMSKHSEH